MFCQEKLFLTKAKATFQKDSCRFLLSLLLCSMHIGKFAKMSSGHSVSCQNLTVVMILGNHENLI